MKLLGGLLLSVTVLHDLHHLPPTHTALLQNRGEKEMKFPSLICLEQLLSPPHTQAEVRSRARAITDLVTSVVLQEETTHGTCARV